MEKVIELYGNKDFILRGGSRVTKFSNKLWKGVAEELSKLGPDDALVLDFTGITVEEDFASLGGDKLATGAIEFRAVIGDKRLKFLSMDKNLLELFKDAMMLSETATNGVFNLNRDFGDRIRVRELDKTANDEVDKYVQEMAQERADKQKNTWMEKFNAEINLDTTTHNVQLYKVASRYSLTFFTYFKEFLEEHDPELFILDIGVRNELSPEEIEMLTKLYKMSNVVLKGGDPDIMDIITQKANMKIGISDEEKEPILFQSLSIGDVGILIQYKTSTKTDKTDSVGRVGGGKVVESRPAIYRGVTSEKGQTYFKFDIFPVVNFHTKLFNELVYEEDRPFNIKTKLLKTSEIGIEGVVSGTHYMFCKPMHEKNEPLHIDAVMRNGAPALTEMTLPEYLRQVLTDRGIQFNFKPLLELNLKCMTEGVHNEEMEKINEMIQLRQEGWE